MIYDMLIPSIPVLGGYLLTYALYRGGIIRKVIHVNVWNFIISLAFLVSAGAGFLLMVLMEMGIALPINMDLLYWHVEFGITLALVTLFHFHIYWKSSKKMFMGNKRDIRGEIYEK